MNRVKSLRIELSSDTSVAALLQMPIGASALYVLAHGAGAGMDHPFMHEVAEGLAQRRIATLRYQFAYMEHGSKRPDRPHIAHASVRAAVANAAAISDLPLFAGGKSFGGRMTSQAEAEHSLQVQGLAFLGFPLHPPEKPGIERAEHLSAVHVPMVFIQGERDKLAAFELISGVVTSLGPKAELHGIAHADHGFNVLVRSGRQHADVMTEVLDALAGWMGRVITGQGFSSIQAGA